MMREETLLLSVFGSLHTRLPSMKSLRQPAPRRLIEGNILTAHGCIGVARNDISTFQRQDNEQFFNQQ